MLFFPGGGSFVVDTTVVATVVVVVEMADVIDTVIRLPVTCSGHFSPKKVETTI